MRRVLSTTALVALTLAGLPALMSCVDATSPVSSGPFDEMPTLSSPTGVVRALEWAWNQHSERAYEAYRLLFTDDFRFAFSPLDTAGRAYRGDTWSRVDELVSFKNLVDTARNASVRFAPSLTVTADPRPGYSDSTVHRFIKTPCSLLVEANDGHRYVAQDTVYFYLARADSASVPPDLGPGTDPRRWFIERWEDQATTPTTWGTIKTHFR